MIADFPVLLDACVLANFGVCDLLLRLAEEPRMFSPRWSESILQEVHRTHLERLKPPWPESVADSWQASVRSAFPEADVRDYESLVGILTNAPKDRHVLAAAIKGNASLIVTFNLRDFPAESLVTWEVNAVHPQDYLLTLYSMNPALVSIRLSEIAHQKKREVQDILLHLGKSVPSFASRVLKDVGMG
jgi:predicted nucleic acid-binding protein